MLSFEFLNEATLPLSWLKEAAFVPFQQVKSGQLCLEVDAPKNIHEQEVLIAPNWYMNENLWAVPVWIPALLTVEGTLKPNPTIPIWVPPEFFNPLSKQGPFFSSAAMFDTKLQSLFYSSDNEPILFNSWQEYYETCEQFIHTLFEGNLTNPFEQKQFQIQPTVLILEYPFFPPKGKAAYHFGKEILNGNMSVPSLMASYLNLSSETPNFNKNTLSWEDCIRQRKRINSSFGPPLSKENKIALHHLLELKQGQSLSLQEALGVDSSPLIYQYWGCKLVEHALEKKPYPLIVQFASIKGLEAPQGFNLFGAWIRPSVYSVDCETQFLAQFKDYFKQDEIDIDNLNLPYAVAYLHQTLEKVHQQYVRGLQLLEDLCSLMDEQDARYIKKGGLARFLTNLQNSDKKLEAEFDAISQEVIALQKLEESRSKLGKLFSRIHQSKQKQENEQKSLDLATKMREIKVERTKHTAMQVQLGEAMSRRNGLWQRLLVWQTLLPNPIFSDSLIHLCADNKERLKILEQYEKEEDEASPRPQTALLFPAFFALAEEIQQFFGKQLFTLALNYWIGRWLLDVNAKSASKGPVSSLRSKALEECVLKGSCFLPIAAEEQPFLDILNRFQYHSTTEQKSMLMIEAIDCLMVPIAQTVSPTIGVILSALSERIVAFGDRKPLCSKKSVTPFFDETQIMRFNLADSYEMREELDQKGMLASNGALYQVVQETSIFGKWIGSDMWLPSDISLGKPPFMAPKFELIAVKGASLQTGYGLLNEIEANAVIEWLVVKAMDLLLKYHRTVIVTPHLAQFTFLKEQLAIAHQKMPNCRLNMVEVWSIEDCLLHSRNISSKKDLVLFSCGYTSTDRKPYVFDQDEFIFDLAIGCCLETFYVFADKKIFDIHTHSPSGRLAKLLFTFQNSEVKEIKERVII